MSVGRRWPSVDHPSSWRGVLLLQAIYGLGPSDSCWDSWTTRGRMLPPSSPPSQPGQSFISSRGVGVLTGAYRGQLPVIQFF